MSIKGGRWLAGTVDSMDTSIQGLEYIKKSQERLIIVARNSIMINRTTTRKQKWEEKQLYVEREKEEEEEEEEEEERERERKREREYRAWKTEDKNILDVRKMERINLESEREREIERERERERGNKNIVWEIIRILWVCYSFFCWVLWPIHYCWLFKAKTS